MRAGRITVNGRVANQPGLTVDADSVQVEIDGKTVRAPAGSDSSAIVIVLNKPVGILSTLEDPQGRPTVLDLIPRDRRLYPIGRLDYDSSGLLLLTNDGELTNRLLHPRYKVAKEYRVRVDATPLDHAELRRFADGLNLDDGPTAPCRIRVLGHNEYLVCLREGRKRQIKRMFQALGRTVIHLHRERFGPILLGSLPSGVWRSVTDQEQMSLYRLTALPIPR